ncbi:MAG: hypothetical protein ACI4FZ_11390 [Lachnospiraceae bacterium]
MKYHHPVSTGLLTGIPFADLLSSDRLGRDIRYMKQYYPKQVRRLAEITELVADRYDTPRSFFYDEFPDRISTLHILKEITDAYRVERALDTEAAFLADEQTVSTIAELLLLQEILLRRMRRRSRTENSYLMP